MAASTKQGSCKGDGLTASEIQRLGTALQKQEFRDLLLEYVEEISDPENQAQYEEDVIAVEKTRGYDVTFVRPEPHYVFKTTLSLRDNQHEAIREKAFVNVCQSQAIEKPSCKRVSAAIARSFGSQESEVLWTVPHSLTYPRDDTDKRQSKCVVYDCVFHPDTLRLAGSNKHFKKMIEDIAIDAVENSFGVQLDRTHLKYPKMKAKGSPMTTILRKKIEPSEIASVSDSSAQCPTENQAVKERVKQVPQSEKVASEVLPENNGVGNPKQNLKCPEDASESISSQHAETLDTPLVVPIYIVKHRFRSDLQDHLIIPVQSAKQVPSELVIEIKLPEVESVSSVTLELKPDRLAVVSLPGNLPRYSLDLKLPYTVDDTNGKAKFCTEKHVLSIELPVVVPPTESTCADACVPPSSTTAGNIEQLSESLSKQLSVSAVADEDDRVALLADTLAELSTVDYCQTDLKYVLPEFSCHQSNDELTFVLKARNITKDSFRIEFTENGVNCRMIFSSVGAGGCPTHYSLFLKFTSECRIVAGAEEVSVAEENAVIILAKHDESKHCWEEFDYGIDSQNVVFHEVFALNALQRKLHILQKEAAAAATTGALQYESKNAQSVKITEVNSGVFAFEIDDDDYRQHCSLANGSHDMDDEADSRKFGGKPDDNSNPQTPNVDNEVVASTKPEETASGLDDNFSQLGILNNDYQPTVRPLRKFRSLSESFDDRSPVRQPRSILKLHLRSRHLSESSDDACWSSQEYSTAMDLDIPEEGSLENLFQARKSVHFNDKIYRNIFRSNSSILGQRKKNQRKERKKREAFKRSSESECSEAETDSVVRVKTTSHKNVLNANRYACDTIKLQYLANDGINVSSQSLDNHNSDVTDWNCEDNKNDGKATKNKSRRRKKRTAKKTLDSEGNSSSDGQQHCAYKPKRIGESLDYINIY